MDIFRPNKVSDTNDIFVQCGLVLQPLAKGLACRTFGISVNFNTSQMDSAISFPVYHSMEVLYSNILSPQIEEIRPDYGAISLLFRIKEL